MLFEEKSAFFLFQVLAGAMEESSGEDDDTNVQHEIKINIINKIVMLLVFVCLFFCCCFFVFCFFVFVFVFLFVCLFFFCFFFFLFCFFLACGGGGKFSAPPPPELMLQHSAIWDSSCRSLHLPINVIQEV